MEDLSKMFSISGISSATILKQSNQTMFDPVENEDERKVKDEASHITGNVVSMGSHSHTIPSSSPDTYSSDGSYTSYGTSIVANPPSEIIELQKAINTIKEEIGSLKSQLTHRSYNSNESACYPPAAGGIGHTTPYIGCDFASMDSGFTPELSITPRPSSPTMMLPNTNLLDKIMEAASVIDTLEQHNKFDKAMGIL